MKYGKWTILELYKGNKCLARCDCGTEKEQWTNNIKSGKSKQCTVCQANEQKGTGLHNDIGGSTHPLYNVWSGVKRRCYNPRQKSYIYYGAKGVTMCDEWLNDYRSFYIWMMENGYKEGMVISRKKDLGNYHPLNCEVKTFSENSIEAPKREWSEDDKYNKSLELTNMNHEQRLEMIRECTSGKYLSNEMVDKYNIDRHSIVRILGKIGLAPIWRKGKFTDEEVDAIRDAYLNDKKSIDLAREYNVSQETICCVVKRRSLYKDR